MREANRMLSHGWIATAVAVVAALTLAPAASATFPGGNGQLVFMTQRDSNSPALYRMNPDGTGQARLSTAGVPNDTAPAISPDGSKVVFASLRATGSTTEIYTMDIDGTDVVRLTNNAFNDTAPAFDPSGNIVFATDRDGNFEIYSMLANGTNPINLTNNGANDFDPDVSPTTGQIAFSSNRISGVNNIWKIDADGGSPTALTAGSFNSGPSFSPDGSKIAFNTNRDGNFEIYAMDADGNNETNLTNSSSDDQAPAFSPDGTRVAFMSNRTGSNFNVFTMDSDDGGNASSALTTAPEFDGQPAWAPGNPGETSITSSPSAVSTDTTPSFEFESDKPADTLECRNYLVAGAPPEFTTCTSPLALPELADGSYRFEVRAKDALGNVDDSPAGAEYAIDTTAGDTTITSGPAASSNDTTPTFGFESAEATDTFECRSYLQTASPPAFADCASPFQLGPLTDGAYRFEVRAKDALGNLDGSPATADFTIDTTVPPPASDTTPPDTLISKGPKKKSSKRRAKFRFRSTEPPSTFRCKVDNFGLVPCTSPFRTPKLDPGKHLFKVVATDAAGNQDPTAARFKFRVVEAE